MSHLPSLWHTHEPGSALGCSRGLGELEIREFERKAASAAIHLHLPSLRDAGTLEAEGPSPNRDDTVTYSVLQKRRVVRGQGCGRWGGVGLASAVSPKREGLGGLSGGKGWGEGGCPGTGAARARAAPPRLRS